MKKFTKLISAFLSLALLLPTAVFSADEDEVKSIDRYLHDFESSTVESKFTEEHNFGISHTTGRMRVSEFKIGNRNNKVLDINTCDIRWWNVDYYDNVMAFDFDVKLNSDYSGTKLVLSIQNHTASTTTESDEGGRVVAVESIKGVPTITDRDGNALMELATDETVYKISVRTFFGSDTYTILCNGEVLSDTCKFVSPIYAIKGMRMTGTSKTSVKSYISIDNIHFYTEGREYPQEFSYDTTGKVEDVEIPEKAERVGIEFWLNNTLMTPSSTPISKDGTVYMPLTWTSEAFGATVVSETDTKHVITSGEFKYTVDGTSLSAGGEPITLNHALFTENGVVYAPAQLFAEVFDAKVYFDERFQILAFTNGEYKSDNILRRYGSYFFYNGEPYYEISFNKFDLTKQIYSDGQFHGGTFPERDYPNASTTVAAAEEALKQLHEAGFKTIRIFADGINPDKNEEDVENYFKATDLMYDLCDKYEIQVVVCMNLISNEYIAGKYVDEIGWINDGENFYDLFCVPESKSRACLYKYIEKYVNRYKDRDTILMWEINNEGNSLADIGYATNSITYSLVQLGEFYLDIANKIRECDPERLISGGDCALREAQWNLYKSTKRGRGPDWGTDSIENRLKALITITKGLDVISTHAYDCGFNSSERYRNEDRKVVNTTWELFLEEAERLGLALYNGETGGKMNENGKGVSVGNTGEKAAEARSVYLNTIIESGVQLTHWWTFHSDRATQGNDVSTWSLRVDDSTASSFEAVKKANEDLKARYLVNAIAAENTDTLEVTAVAETSAEAETDVPADQCYDKPADSENNGVTTAVIITAVAVVAVVAAAVVLTKKKKA